MKKLYDLSDEILISSAQTDMAYKFFGSRTGRENERSQPSHEIQKNPYYEIAEKIGLKEPRARQLLNELVAMGRLICTVVIKNSLQLKVKQKLINFEKIYTG